MSAIAAYRTAILALLSDASSAIFSANDIDQALRWALAEYSLRRPLIRTYIYDVDTSTTIHTLPADFVTDHITRVELWDAVEDNMLDLAFYAFWRDEQWIVQTVNTVAAGEDLQISYAAPHQIDGLDAAAGTTVPHADETLLQVGAAGRAALMRALDRVETINMNPDVVKAYMDTSKNFIEQFKAGLLPVSSASFAQLNYPGGMVY